MAKQTINVGSSANKGDGDPLRTAFGKINENFTEVYSLLGASDGDTDDVIAPMLVHSNHTNVTVTRDDDANLIIFSVDQAVTDLKGSVFADDSTLLVDGVDSSINLDGTVKGNIVPDANEAYDLGSTTNRFRDLYLSGSTIDLGGTTLSIVGGNLQIGGTDIKDVVTAAGIDYTDIQNTPTIPTAVSDLTNDTGFITSASALTAGSNIPTLEAAYTAARGTLDVLLSAADYGAQLAPPSDYTYYEIALRQKALNPLIPDEVVDEALNVLNAYNAWQNEIEAETATITVGDREWKFKGDGTVDGLNVDGDITGSVFADDSTVLVDGIAGKIVGDIETNSLTIGGTGFVNFNNDAYDDTYRGGFTTNKSILQIIGADYLAGSDDGGGVIISGGTARNGGNNGDVIIASGVGGADNTGYISLLANYITSSGTWIGTQTMDIKGSVFGDDSTLLVDGVAGKIVGPYDNGVVSINSTNVTTYDIFVQQDANTNDLYVANRIYGGATGATTTLVIGSTTTIESDVNFNDVVKFAKTTTTGADDNPTLTLIDVNSSGVQVLTSNDNTTNNWELPDGSEGQIMHFVAGGAGGSGANHKIKINNWWNRDGDTGVWSSGSGYWDVFAIYGFAGRTDTGMATAIFVDGAWRTTSPWVD